LALLPVLPEGAEAVLSVGSLGAAEGGLWFIGFGDNVGLYMSHDRCVGEAISHGILDFLSELVGLRNAHRGGDKEMEVDLAVGA